MDIDQVVREAVRDSEPCQLDARAGALITRLADLETIRRLAAVKERLPEVGAYELLDELGRGGMGTVYRAKHRQLGKIQALKIIHGPSKLTPEIRARFRREVQAIGALKHPNIIAAHDADFEGDVPYLVMDYVEGESLAEIQQRLKSEGKTVSVGAACELVRQAAMGLQYAHDQKITHRDIKPGNLMLDGEGIIRVLDLGLARLGTQDDASEHEATELTRGGQILGTPDYMSPEQLQSSREVDARTDVYALGVTLFSLLVGRPAYRGQPGESFIAKAARILHEPVPDLRTFLPELPKPLADIIQKCLAKSPDERFQSAGELGEALSKWASPDAVKALLPGTIPSPKQPSNTPVVRSDTTPSRSKLPPRILIGIAAAIMFPLLILAGVLLTLKLPDGGELIVECDDPQDQAPAVATVDENQTPEQAASKRSYLPSSLGLSVLVPSGKHELQAIIRYGDLWGRFTGFVERGRDCTQCSSSILVDESNYGFCCQRIDIATVFRKVVMSTSVKTRKNVCRSEPWLRAKFARSLTGGEPKFPRDADGLCCVRFASSHPTCWQPHQSVLFGHRRARHIPA